MPSIVKSWVEDHEDIGLSLLQITSDDPRRNGRVDLAFFDINISKYIREHEWVIRRSVPYCVEKQSTLAAYCAEIYGVNPERREPNEDYTRDNYIQRKTLSREEFLSSVAAKKRTLHKEFFKYKEVPGGMDDIVTLKLQCQCKRYISIKIKKRHIVYVPKKVFFSRRKGQLCLWPIVDADGYRKETPTLAYYILNKVNNLVHGAAYRRLSTDLLNYVIREDNSGYENSITSYNKYHSVDEGVVIEVGGTRGVYKQHWQDFGNVYVYPRGFIEAEAERKVYFLVSESYADYAREYAHVSFDGVNTRVFDSFNKDVSLTRSCAEHGGLQIKDVYVAPRLNKVYARALDKGIDGYATRAKYENKIMSDMRTNGKMYKAGKVYKYKRVYADTTAKVTLPSGESVYCLDLRPDHLVVGAKARHKIQEARPMSKHEIESLIEKIRSNQPLREDI